MTESFPGQFRNWFYSLLAMSTVLRRETPFKTLFGYALVFGEDGRQMHKSWGNAIEFDEAAERMGVDVMRWMFANARPEDNINFGWHAADEARRRLLVLWNVYSFFVTYARLAGLGADRRRRRRVAERGPLDRWILSRVARLAERGRNRPARSTTRSTPPGRSTASSRSCRRGICAARASASAGAPTPRTGPPPSPRCMPTLVALTRIIGPDHAVPVRGDVPEPGRCRRGARARRTAST